jgi:cytochrome P450
VTVTCDLDLTDPSFVADPYPTLAMLRSRGPVQWHERTGRWLTFSHAAANAVLRERGLGRIWSDRSPADRFEPFNLLHRHQMMENEPPEHGRLRRLVASAFSRGHVERLRPRVAALANALLDGVDPDGFDLVEDYAEPLPVSVIAELLGIPTSDRPLLRPWSQAIVKMYEHQPSATTTEAAIEASRDFAAYVRALVRERRSAPREDLITDLVAAQDGPARLSEDEVVASAILLLNAGHEASVNGFGNGAVALLDRPLVLAQLAVEPSGTALAVEEMLRFDAPLQLFERTAVADVVVADVTIRAGERAVALLGAANRDPAVFPAADDFVLGREPNSHLGFGAGLHFCLGAPLARMELAITWQVLLARMPRLVATAEPVRRPGFVLRGFASVPVSARG